jgi:hypothetical protein
MSAIPFSNENLSLTPSSDGVHQTGGEIESGKLFVQK